MKTSLFVTGLLGLLAFLPHGAADGAPVTESEAIAIAESWYAAELSADTTALPQAEKLSRVAAKNRHGVSYVLGRDNWQTVRKETNAVAAYVVAFQPSGFVVVSGEDTLQPVLVFNATGTFNCSGDPKTNYLSYFLKRCVAGAVERERSLALKHATHTNWTRLREWTKSSAGQSGGASGFPSPAGSSKAAGTYVTLPTALWNQENHYNNACVANNGGKNVPTGCVATALAIQFQYYQWPWVGNGSHTDNDNSGSVRYNHTLNFGAQIYDWANMPTNDLTADNADVEDLMYACGVAVDMDYEVGASSAWPSDGDISPAMNNYFCYRGTYVNNSSRASDHTPAISCCIQCGVPVVVGTADHCFVACGYRDTVAPYFYFNMGWGGGNNAWYNVTDIVPDSDNPLNGSLPYSTPNDYAYVDTAVASNGNGNLQTPYKTVANGQSGVTGGGVLWLKAGQYEGAGNSGLSLNKPMTLKCYLGAATIGP